MRLATLHRPDGKTILVNPENVMLLYEPPENDFSSGGNCIVMFVDGFEQPITENIAAAAAIIEGPHGHS